MKLFCFRDTARIECALLQVIVLVLLISGFVSSTQAQTEAPVDLNISADTLHAALQQFSEQTKLQLLYQQNVLTKQRTVKINGTLTASEALNRLLRGSDLNWQFINATTVSITARRAVATINVGNKDPSRVAARPLPRGGDVTELSDIDVNDSYWWSRTSSDAAFGFTKLLLETPRSIAIVGNGAIDSFSLSAVEDLLSLVPGVFTTTRFGVQGSIDIRNVPADTYFRGIKRLTLQGHGRSVLAAMDSIEVVGGPASPLFGLGKVGGYTNVVPKSGRARSGMYLDSQQGFAQLIGGQYARRELSFGLGGPVRLSANEDVVRGGYYLYGLIENSDSYAQGVPVRQKIIQAATSIDEVLGSFRLETGASYQESRTAGALIGRLTQQLVDNNAYIGGLPLVNLDLNDNGRIGYLEMQQASPVQGTLNANNQPLNQVFAWPVDASGQPLPLEQFPQVSGIPQTMYTYLAANPAADPTGLLRAQGVGGPQPISGAVPVGMILDPRSITGTEFNSRRSAAFEKELKAEFITAFADLIYDRDPQFTLRNQLFFDAMHQYKSSNQPFSQVQDVHVLEDKLTVTYQLPRLPSFLRVNSLFTVNARTTVSEGKMTLGDYSNHRTDATAASWNTNTGGMIDNTTFTSANENTNLNDDGLPWNSLYRSRFSELGIGFLFDINVLTNTNLLLGIRHDGSAARNTDYAGRFNINTGTASNPGAYLANDDTASAWDSGNTWSMSISHTLPYGLRPYATVSRASIMLDGNNNSLQNATIRAGHIGAASLKELGVKANWMDGRLQASTAVYEQGREEIAADDDASLLSAYATATTTRGWQAELRWLPVDGLMLGWYALHQVTRYTPNVGGLIQVDARALGFNDVVDANGKVIYPAEAFLYGGRARINLPNGLQQYEKKQGNPPTQIGLNAIYQFNKYWGLILKANYLSSTCTGRLCLVKLPQSKVFDTGVYFTGEQVDLRLDVANVGNLRYFRARTGDTLGDVIAQAMPGRRWQAMARYKF
jgi:outer membrane receptor protein involved in Fe transport